MIKKLLLTLFSLVLAATAITAPVQASDANPDKRPNERPDYLPEIDAAVNRCIGRNRADIANFSDCIGVGANWCQEATDWGMSNQGMAHCARAETQTWDRLLNESYQAVMADFKKIDAEERNGGYLVISRADSLRDAQRLWIKLRDADCMVVQAFWGSGSMRIPATAFCQLEATAERAIHLIGLEQDPM